MATSKTRASATRTRRKSVPKPKPDARTSEDRALVHTLEAWFARHARLLPWRQNQDPYAVWVSEVMLQQTQVATVIPYFRRFLQAFPSPEHAVAAGQERVLAHWSGLGYYRRARLLFDGLSHVVNHHGGRVPKEKALRDALPGVGPYTSGAIGSIAFGLREAAVDGNVKRVFARLFRWNAAQLDRHAGPRAQALVAVSRSPSAWNQALMDLGATVCTPKTPNCAQCPVQKFCAAFATGDVAKFPVPKPKAKRKLMRVIALVVQDARGRCWIRDNKNTLFSGLFGPPWIEADALELARLLPPRIGPKAAPAMEIGTVEHTLTHRDLHTRVFHVATKHRALPDSLLAAGWRAVTVEEFKSLPTATYFRKILALAERHRLSEATTRRPKR